MSIDVGIVLSADYLPHDQIIKLSPMIDNLGYSQISVPEIWGHDAFTLLAVLAHKTKLVEIATDIVNIFSRSPATMAMTAASIDNLSNKRFILGLGVSGPGVIEDKHGIKFTKPLTRTREYVSLVRAMLSRQRVNQSTTQLGEIKNFRISIRDVRAEIPIHIASLGPKNVKLTAEIADGWIPVIMPIDAFEAKVADIYSYLSLFHKDENEFAITPFIPTLIGTSQDELTLLKGHLVYYFAQMGDFYNNMLARSGFEKEAETILTEWRKGNVKAARDVISEELLDQMTIWGTTDHALDQLKKFSNAGATRPLLTLPFKTSLDQGLKTFQALAPSNETM